MNNEQFKKQISAIVEKQFKIATGRITEQVSKLVDELVDDFGPEMELEDVIKWIGDNQLSWQEEREILEKLSNTEIVEYYVANIKEDNNEIVIICDSMVQREKIKNFLETEIFPDSARYSAAVENL